MRVSFPDELAREQAAMLDVVALEPGADASCQQLVTAQAEPGDTGYQIEDRVSIDLAESTEGQALQDIGPGERLFFAEARDATGLSILRGCTREQAGGSGIHEVLIELTWIEETCTTDEDCDDNLWCNGLETCQDGRCTAGERDCDDGDPCTQDSCDDDFDVCLHPPVAEPPGEEGPVGDPSCQDGVDNDCDGMTDDDDTGCRVCQADSDCDDHNPCTFDRCERGACAHEATNDGTVCNDGLVCTVEDSCQQGVCTGEQRDCSHLDGACSLGRCSEDLGACVAQPLADGTVCDDGQYCTVDDACLQGNCSGSPRDCSDDDVCTTDTCDEAADSCSHQLSPRPGEEGPWDDATCDDGQDNDCDGLTDIEDNDCAQCTSDGDCDDGNFCTSNTCVDGRCQAENRPEGTDCDDGLFCTQPDSCNGGVCGGPARDCSHLDGDCVQGVCDEAASSCSAEPANGGQACEDGDPCTEGESCQGGLCAGGVPVDCSHLDDLCSAGVCDQQTGDCVQEFFADGTVCDDGVFCNGPDNCDGTGACIPADNNPCGVCQVCNESAASCDPLPASSICQEDALIECDGAGNLVDQVDCPLGCNSDSNPARCLRLDPSNLPQGIPCAGNGNVTITLPVTIDTDAGTITGAGALDFVFNEVAQGLGNPSIGVFSFNRLEILGDVTVQGDNALALVACTDLIVDAVIDSCATGPLHGPGGGDGGTAEQSGTGYENGSGGPGEGTAAPVLEDSGGGGGACGAAGGDGGSAPSLAGGAGGIPYGNATLVSLRGGSGGGGGGQGTGTGGGLGGGGGAVQLVAGGSLVIMPGAGVHACGAGGGGATANGDGGGGGGAGGAVLLEAAAVTINGILAANGGGGGGGDESNGLPSEATSGEDGTFGSTPAMGGLGGMDGGDGGMGGAGNIPGGETAQPNQDAGGGGGAAGRIRINTRDGAVDIGGTISPSASAGLYTQGTVQTW